MTWVHLNNLTHFLVIKLNWNCMFIINLVPLKVFSGLLNVSNIFGKWLQDFIMFARAPTFSKCMYMIICFHVLGNQYIFSDHMLYTCTCTCTMSFSAAYVYMHVLIDILFPPPPGSHWSNPPLKVYLLPRLPHSTLHMCRRVWLSAPRLSPQDITYHALTYRGRCSWPGGVGNSQESAARKVSALSVSCCEENPLISSLLPKTLKESGSIEPP